MDNDNWKKFQTGFNQALGGAPKPEKKEKSLGERLGLTGEPVKNAFADSDGDYMAEALKRRQEQRGR